MLAYVCMSDVCIEEQYRYRYWIHVVEQHGTLNQCDRGACVCVHLYMCVCRIYTAEQHRYTYRTNRVEQQGILKQRNCDVRTCARLCVYIFQVFIAEQQQLAPTTPRSALSNGTQARMQLWKQLFWGTERLIFSFSVSLSVSVTLLFPLSHTISNPPPSRAPSTPSPLCFAAVEAQYRRVRCNTARDHETNVPFGTGTKIGSHLLEATTAEQPCHDSLGLLLQVHSHTHEKGHRRACHVVSDCRKACVLKESEQQCSCIMMLRREVPSRVPFPKSLPQGNLQ